MFSSGASKETTKQTARMAEEVLQKISQYLENKFKLKTHLFFFIPRKMKRTDCTISFINCKKSLLNAKGS